MALPLVAWVGIGRQFTYAHTLSFAVDILFLIRNQLLHVILQMLDLCLSMGSKDNMTSLIVKFPAQTIGEGGGVTARRQKREAALQGTAGTITEEPIDDTEVQDT